MFFFKVNTGVMKENWPNVSDSIVGVLMNDKILGVTLLYPAISFQVQVGL